MIHTINETPNSKPWEHSVPPKRILIIRLQAFGDTIITLPYIQGLRNTLPTNCKIDFLTRKEVAIVPKSIILFDKVFALGGGRIHKLQQILILFLLPKLFSRRYDIIIDLQNNQISRLVRKYLFPKSWSQFDKYSPISAGKRYQNGIEAVGMGGILPSYHFKTKLADSILKAPKFKQVLSAPEIVVLNPAGYGKTRNWATENYIAFANYWIEKKNKETKFLFLGINKIAQKAKQISEALPSKNVINLVNQTTQIEAFLLLQKVTLIVTEDSGLMHLSWISGVPTLALFGSSRSYWSKPLGAHSLCLDSSDLPCGNCMLEECTYGDVRCLTRYTPIFVYKKALKLLQKKT